MIAVRVGRPLGGGLLLVFFAAFACGLSAQVVSHTFRLDTTGWASLPESIHVAGTFNGWSRNADPMQPGEGGHWSATLELEPGIYQYKFVVNGTRWVADPLYSDADLEQPDGHGGNNSAVLIGEDARKLPEAQPNHLLAEAMEHDPEDFQHRSIVSNDTLLLGLDLREGDADRVMVAWSAARAGHHEEWAVQPMMRESSDLGLDRYVALIQTSGETPLRYVFLLRDGGQQFAFDAGGLRGLEEGEVVAATDAGVPFEVAMTPTFVTPDWAKHAVWYQVFVERFRNGDPSNDPGDAPYETLLPWTVDWWATHPEHGEVAGDENFHVGHGNVWRRRFGGDLQGLQQALPYLRELGVNALYLNPIFEAESMHKYDTADFRHIDDNFGVKSATPTEQVAGETDDPATWGWSESDRVFLAFLEAARAEGFRVAIDGVFNHVGRAHPYFMDVLEHGPASPYAEWFEITDWGKPEHWRKMDEPFAVHGKPGGIQWNAWDQANGHLPIFKNDPATGLAEGPRQHIFNITRRWMDPNGDGDPSDGIDGWRLDVPGDIAHPFWIEWRKLVKGINPEAYITGEIWSWAHPWLQGDQFDAVMNYQFAMPALDFFADERDAIAPSEFGQRMSRVVFNYPMQVSLAQMNLYDSHDTDRLASMFVNPDRGYDGQNRLQDTGPDYDAREPNEVERRRMMQAVAFKMTFVGAPMIYYGTEAGMWSPDDPSNRMPMVWPDLGPYEGQGVRFRDDLFAVFRHLIAMRNTLPALRLGSFEVVHADDEAETFAFARRHGSQAVWVVLNRSDERRVVRIADEELAMPLVDLADSKQTRLIEPQDAQGRATLGLVAEAESLPMMEDQAGRTCVVTLQPFGYAVLVAADSLVRGEAEADGERQSIRPTEPGRR